MSETTIAFALESAGMLLALAMALGATRLGAAQFNLLAPGDAEAVPVFHMSAVLAGLLCGIALLIVAPHLDAFAPREIFAENSAWSVDLREFLARYALPQDTAFGTLADALRGRGDWLVIALAWASVGAVVFGCLAALRFWRGWNRLRALLAFLSLTAWIALLIGYVAHLSAWVAAQLSFWIFLLLLIALQRWRHRSRVAH
ncbi:hypothetical protein GXW78_07150 [Roseomonas terrae]|uniref:Uncharacterized protein n=1 Tax=Neoroseomonas terrae TaxID=424799 RepID=A0ABS5EEI6_9PROT|nr:hypothetical protein [Neoroseomonas terrae]MBR0649434.1 hypothetical protein [Neoroseomonas terrae]